MPVSKHPRAALAAAVVVLLLVVSMSAYTVKTGDTLSEIAGAHGVTTADLAAVNDLADPNRIFAGQSLKIPGQAGAPSAGGGLVTHIVAPGESLAVIAAKYGTTVKAIAEANGILNTNLVYSGTQLIVGGDVPSVSLSTASSGGTHIVAAGETLSEIAARYGVKTAELADANGIANPNLVRIGQKLIVPGDAGFRCPVVGATFFNDWGFPRSGGRFHEGNDMFAPRGTAVIAPVSGYVYQINGTIGGIQYRLDGDDGNRYIGTHMDAFGAGGQVTAGDVIGYVGDTGNAKGSSPHLHFEILVDRQTPINPYPIILKACSSTG